MIVSANNLTVRVGCHVVYETAAPTPILLVMRPRRDADQIIMQEQLTFAPHLHTDQFIDTNGNVTERAILQVGENVIHHDAIICVAPTDDAPASQAHAIPVNDLPADTLRFTLPSRYCDSDKLLNLAWSLFGHIENGLPRVQAICDWTHNNIEYRFGAGRSDISASEVVQQRFGVCRDFAHVMIAFCRAFNLPARYVSGHLPDIAHLDPGTPMDFHAYCEVFLGRHWYTFDARYNEPRIGRVKVAHGLDAVDGAFSTIYGSVAMKWFEVWAYQVNPLQVKVGDPVDMSKRLDGGLALRRS